MGPKDLWGGFFGPWDRCIGPQGILSCGGWLGQGTLLSIQGDGLGMPLR